MHERWQTLKVVWCRLFHRNLRWPIHGCYQCRQCRLQHPVVW